MIAAHPLASARALALLVPVAASLGAPARAQCVPAEITKIVAFDAGAGDRYGSSVAMSSVGGIVLVGAPLDDDFSTDSGAVYAYSVSGTSWSLQGKLKAGDAQAFDQFGASVAINDAGDRAVIGARLDDDLGSNAGAVYVFVRSGSIWSQQTKLKANDGAASDQFGLDVDIDSIGTTIVVGAPFDDIGLIANAGSAHIYRFSGSWAALDKLVANDLAPNDNFGASVALGTGSSSVLCGAPLVDVGLEVDAGAVYAFRDIGGGFVVAAKLTAPDAQAGDQLGDAVALSTDGTRALAGAAGEDAGGTDAGAAYLWEDAGAWGFQAKILSPTAAVNDRFGTSVAIDADGDKLVVGAPLGDGAAADAGTAHVFFGNLGSWAQAARLQIGDGLGGDAFGQSVAINAAGALAFAGTPGNDDFGSDSGTAHVMPTSCPAGPFTFFCFGDGSVATACPCGNAGATGRGCANSQNGAGALLNAAGSVSPDQVVLSASGETSTANSIFLQGDAQIVAGSVFGDGVRCTGGVLLRLFVKGATGGSVSAPSGGDPSLTARAAALGDLILPGSVRFYQVYYRDPDLGFCPNPPGNSFNVTNAVRIAW